MASSEEDPDKTEIRSDRGSKPPELTDEVPTVPHVQQGTDIQSLVGSCLDHYLIESLVGQGGMGAVYRATDQRLDRLVAVKVVPVLHRKADAMRRFRIEAQSAAKLDHPNIARVYNVGETQHWNYIVFEFIEGINLRQLILDRGPLSVDDATYFTCQVAEALQHASERGVVHRDIKPSNILLATDGKAKIVDMGLARTTALDRSQGDQTASGTTLGTFDYISPEQAHDPREADARSDIYSLGCTLYFLLTGQPPFPEGTALQKLLMHGTKMPEDPRLFRDDLSDPLIAILKKMMAKKPRDRYQSPEDLASDLRMLAKLDNLAWSSDLAEFVLAHRPSRRSWLEALLPMLLCLTLIGAVTLWLWNANQVDAVFPIPKVEIANVSIDAGDQGTATGLLDSNPIDKKPTDKNPRLDPLVQAPKPLSESISEKEIKPDATVQADANVTDLLVGDNLDEVSQLQSLFPEGKPKTLKSLDDALAEASSLTTACRIWISQDCVVQKRYRPSGAERAGADRAGAERAGAIAIRSVPGKRYSIRIDESAVSGRTGEYSCCFELDGGPLSFSDVDVLWNLQGASSSPKALIAARPGSRLVMENSTVTINGPSAGSLPSLLAIEAQNRESTNGTPNPNAQRFSDLRIEQCSVRGDCDLVHADPTDRLEIRIRDSWFAISGSMVVSQALRSIQRSPRVRVEIADSTCISLKPWLRIQMSNANPYPVAVVRVANQCIFAGAKSLVEWDATDCTDWVFASQVKKLDDLGRWIDFRGLDNAYDGGSIEELIRVQMSMSSEELQIDTDSNLLRNELGMEVLGVWQQKTAWDPLNMHQSVPVPIPLGILGFEIGAPLGRLPEFPNR
ncbi:MAG: serine/threonine-protein kinase [Planctomycetota bacterium]|nr:serine/threonine-protein kinase [Planctomycetota bacterium]